MSLIHTIPPHRQNCVSRISAHSAPATHPTLSWDLQTCRAESITAVGIYTNYPHHSNDFPFRESWDKERDVCLFVKKKKKTWFALGRILTNHDIPHFPSNNQTPTHPSGTSFGSSFPPSTTHKPPICEFWSSWTWFWLFPLFEMLPIQKYRSIWQNCCWSGCM